MENKLKCRPILLEQRNDSINFPCIVSNKDGSRMEWTDCKVRCPCLYYQLYLVSDREIKEGDHYIVGNIRQSNHGVMIADTKEHADSRNELSKLMLNSEGTKEFVICKKVEATTDKSLGLPLIPQKWVEEVYVPKQGKLNSIWIEMYDDKPVTTPVDVAGGKYVLIHAIKESWNREEVIQKLIDYREHCRTAILGACLSASTWFDQNC